MIKTIYMGQFDTVRTPDVLKTTLGSCVGLVLYDPTTDIFGMAHIMLPACPMGVQPGSGKYANTAIPTLIQKMGVRDTRVLRAKVAGGANMFASLKPGSSTGDTLRVGERNVQATLDVLKELGIEVIGSQLGGVHGRELTIDAQSGKIWVRTIGSEPAEL
jgi:chemotaxis protein CheD